MYAVGPARARMTRACLTLLALLCIGFMAGAPQSVQAQDSVTAFRGARLILGDGTPPI